MFIRKTKGYKMIRLCAFSDEAADSLRGQIAALHRNNIALTELRSVDKTNVSAFSEKEANEIRRILYGEGISVWSVGSPLGKCDIVIPEQEWAEQTRRICGIANALGTDKIRAFSFFNAYGQREKVIDYLNTASEIATEFGVTLCHENEKEIYGDTYERVLDLMNSLNGWKFIYDPANFIQCGEKAEDTLLLAKECEYYHIKDVVSATGELVPAGEGDGKIDELLRLIDKDAVFTVEPHLAVFGAYSQIDNTEMKLRHSYENNQKAFDAAVSALKKLLEAGGWQSYNGGYAKNGSGN